MRAAIVASDVETTPVIKIDLRLVTRDCESDVALGRQFRFVNRSGIEIKSRARLRMTQQSLNCLNVFALVG
jgi:hypothetical protein